MTSHNVTGNKYQPSMARGERIRAYRQGVGIPARSQGGYPGSNPGVGSITKEGQ